MKKTLTTLGVALFLGATSSYSNSLSHSLNSLLHEKDKSGMVNLSSINLNGKPKKPKVVKRVFKGRAGKTVIGHYNDGKDVRKSDADKYIKRVTKGKIKDLDMLPKKQRLLVLDDLQKMYAIKHYKSRSPRAVVATVDGQKIRKRTVDAFLKKVTSGKVKDFDRLEKKQRMALLTDFARPMIVKNAIKNGISAEEKSEIFKQVWLEKQRETIKITPEEMVALYEKKKAETLATNPQAQIPPYITLGDRLRSEILDRKIKAIVMKDVNITINYDSNESLVNLDKTQITKETEQ